ncbi:prepilin-type N-terminal cleavage/methylation domain-containing protein [Roseateles paludis]|jgi:general secretion pathway protein J|uniref:Prepilin-type N-terminal cleavage/methylation domain-containing protein n=1 Tax=Roseateles paludis TaxID=3145238 RepID=A0ABV0G4K2_9BURK
MRSQHGFTLVEVLVALVIMATMAAMSWRGLDALTKTREVAQHRLAQTARLQTVLDQWETDLRALQDSKSEVPPLSFDGGTLTLTRATPDGLQVVVWSLREGTVYRWASAPLRTLNEVIGERQRGQQALAQRNQALRALEGVAGWQFYCFRGNAWSNCLSSADEVPDQAPIPKNALPSGLRMQMQFAPGAGLNGSLVREIELAAP